MHFVKGKLPETQYATRPGARVKRREVALGRPGFEPGRRRAQLSITGVNRWAGCFQLLYFLTCAWNKNAHMTQKNTTHSMEA
jgi:hypothetical protein